MALTVGVSVMLRTVDGIGYNSCNLVCKQSPLPTTNHGQEARCALPPT